MFNIIKIIIPKWLRIKVNNKLGNMSAPKMIYGYFNKNGRYRPNTRISNSCFIYHPEKIGIEDNVFIWHYTILDGTGGIKIKEGTQIGAWVGLFTHSSHISIRLLGKNYLNIPEYEKPSFIIAPIDIGKYVFIASGAFILPGVKIGNYSIVTAYSVVKRDIAPYTIVAGNPARVIGRTFDLDLKEFEKLNRRDKWYDFVDKEYIENIKKIKRNMNKTR